MIQYKGIRNMKQLNEKQLFDLIGERLGMQSTRRAVELYNLPKYTVSYFKSYEFAQIFHSWDENKQKNFLRSLAGGYARDINRYISNLK